MIKVKVKIPIFTGSLTIILGKDLAYVQKKYKTPPLEAFGAVTLRGKGARSYVVAFENKDDVGLIAHEAVHIVNLIFLDCGQELDRTNDEAQAYLTAWVVDTIYEHINS